MLCNHSTDPIKKVYERGIFSGISTKKSFLVDIQAKIFIFFNKGFKIILTLFDEKKASNFEFLSFLFFGIEEKENLKI